MAGKTGRPQRVADRIKTVIAQTLDRGVKDPRVGFVTLTDVRVTNDLQHATIFYTVYGDAESREATARALESAKGLLRSEVGKNLNSRLTPTLEFIPDAIPENAALIESLLHEAASKDAAVAAQAKGASYAGDENPYVTDDESDEQ